MRTFYRITISDSEQVILKNRKISKALRRWLRQNGINFKSDFFVGYDE